MIARSIAAGYPSGGPPPLENDFGFNFRLNEIYVTDPDTDVFVRGTQGYPQVYTNTNGESLTAGWVVPSLTFDADRSTGYAPEIAGINYRQNSTGVAVFRVDITGPVEIDTALGDAVGAWSHSMRVFDGSHTTETPFKVQGPDVAVPNGEFLMIDDVIVPGASWSRNAHTLARTINNYLSFEICWAGSNYTCMSHIGIQY